ncbi:hypothetical protein B0T22DRAFT_248087 [Podospora appendiculata]|uniref:Early meiotic induction protein 1 n=1 Tax=Podospora appendiculata TaxID=314037 RepID=A0AAE0X2F5_9PEZI|nr:hypothetical protein B0T22DRAFT_248087 [Podospora appendiculata]
MGWFWQSSSPDSTPPSGQSSTPSQTTSTTTTATMAPPPTAPRSVDPPASTSTTPTTDREVEKFWSMLVEESKSPKPASPPQPATETTTATPPPPPPTTKPSTSWMGWAGLPSPPPAPSTTAASPPSKPRTPQSAALSDASLPLHISCRDAFDYAWHCHTPASQFNAIYRYGTMRSCSDLWDDFWFCMRVKSYPPDLKAEAIKEHYRAKEVSKYYAAPNQPSSEDVWESRDDKVAPGTAFRASFDGPIENDAEFQRKDAERRRAIRRDYGIEEEDERKKD